MIFTAGILENPIYFDILIKSWFDNISSAGMDIFFKLISEFGSPWAYIFIGLLAFVYLWYKGQLRTGIVLNAGLIASWITMKYLKLIINRDRPPGEHLVIATGQSFPSGHAMLSLAFYGFIAYLLLQNLPEKAGKIWTILLAVLVLLIGMSRIYLNVHYASDVLAGFILGGGFLLFMIKIHRKMR